MAAIGAAVDLALEASVVGSFSRVGFAARSRLGHWSAPPDMAGKVAVVTGGSSGIGRAVAVGLAGLGAQVWLVGRDPGRTTAAAEMATDAARGAGWSGTVHPILADVADGGAVAGLVDAVSGSCDHVDALVHCAGALLTERSTTSDGVELTVATHLLGPFALTWLLSGLLRHAGRRGGSAVVTMTSGGMYAERFDLTRLEMAPGEYNGTRAYARAKRAQVVLSHEWARRFASDGVASYATHPGWVDTPGLTSGLPGFARRMRPLLRTPEQGADTAVWLAAGGARTGPEGGAVDGLWLDRSRRPEYRVPRTRPAGGSPALVRQGEALWQWCAERTGLGADTDERP